MPERQWRFADIEIAPDGDLENTARILGEALGGLSFNLDTSGFYEEYPAFVATRGEFEYALLGPPDPNHDVREESERTNYFQLMVRPVESNERGVNTDISADILSQIHKHGRLRCRRME